MSAHSIVDSALVTPGAAPTSQTVLASISFSSTMDGLVTENPTMAALSFSTKPLKYLIRATLNVHASPGNLFTFSLQDANTPATLVTSQVIAGSTVSGDDYRTVTLETSGSYATNTSPVVFQLLGQVSSAGTIVNGILVVELMVRAP